MSDLIDRQAAIDAFNTGLNELVVDGEENAKTVENYLNRVIEKIKCLPPVQLATDTNVGTKLGTNLAEVGTDCISRQAAIDAILKQTVCATKRELVERCDANISDENGWLGGICIALDTIEDLPSAQPEIIYCKDCRKHNKKIGFDENFHTVWKEDACPLVSWRGKAQGHEYDYQYCVYAERKVTE